MFTGSAGRIPSNQRFDRPRYAYGFTLFELMLAGAVCALLVAIATPSYRSIIERQKVGQCVRDLAMFAEKIEKYRTMHGFKPPMSLGELGAAPPKDPWGFDYRYLNFASNEPGVKGKIRKDHNLHPLNSEYDLYSVGPDGTSSAPLTATASRDDVIWARDGAFVGVARDY